MENILGKNLRIIRKKLGLNQTDFGKPLNLKVSSISAIETGKYVPSNAIIELIEIKYRLNRIWLFTGEGDPCLEPKDGEKGIENGASIYKVGNLDNDPDTNKLLIMTREVISSHTDHAQTLITNIRSSHRGMVKDREMESRVAALEEAKDPPKKVCDGGY